MRRQIENLMTHNLCFLILISCCRDENKQQCFQHDGSTDVVATLLLHNIALVHSQTVWTFQLKKKKEKILKQSIEILNRL